MIRSAILFPATAIAAALWLSASANAGDTASAPSPQKQSACRLEFGPGGKLTKDHFLATNGKDQPRKVVEAMAQAFDRLDANGDGVLTMAEFMEVAKKQQNAEEADSAPAKPTAPDDEPVTEPPQPVIPPSILGSAEECSYAVVISSTSLASPEWKAVSDALVKKHHAKLITYKGSVVNCLPALAGLHPRYTAFVTRPNVLGRIYVARIHRLTRHLDADPYTDTIWGIMSAATPQAALRMAEATEPQIVHSAITLTGVHNNMFDEVYTVSDGSKGGWSWKHADKEESGNVGEDTDRVKEFIGKFAALHPDSIVGSGHATERNLEMCFSKGNTEARDGKWYGMANWREPVLIEPDNHPRIFIGAGNCLIGNFHKSADSMAPTLISAYTVNQFVGYTVPTWYGKGGWGTIGLWQNLPGTYSLAEAWYFNNQVITHELQTRFPKSAGLTLPISEKGHGLDEQRIFASGVSGKDEAGMLWDRDVVAFYGDPALRCTLDPKKCPADIKFSLKENNGAGTFEMTVGKPAPGSTGNGPACFRFPKRMPGKITIISGQEYEPVIADDFIILTKPDYTAGKASTVRFRVTR